MPNKKNDQPVQLIERNLSCELFRWEPVGPATQGSVATAFGQSTLYEQVRNGELFPTEGSRCG